MAEGHVRVVVRVAATSRAATVGHVLRGVHEDGPREPLARVSARNASEKAAKTVLRARQPVHRHEERRHVGHSVQLARVQGKHCYD